MAGNYLGTTALYLIPNVLGALIYFTEFGGPFLAMGIPVAVIGTLNSIAEGSSRKNVLVYPQKNTLENLSNFARFPAGRPENINLRELKLKPAPAFR